MSVNHIKSILVQGIRNIPGWRTNRKIVLFESDDWGSIRMPSKEAYESLLRAGIRVNECPYDRYDALESGTDLSNLFDILSGFKDQHGSYPVITANTLVANPDFEKIRDNYYDKYHYEIFTATYQKYSSQSNTFSVLGQGINESLFYPQFHGREHLNVLRWMRALQSGLPEVRLAFDMNLFSVTSYGLRGTPEAYLQAFEADELSDIEYHKTIIADGLRIFRETFGFSSKSFIAPNYIWHYDLDTVLSANGIRYFQGKGYRKIPTIDRNTILRYSLGKRNELNQVYLRRNCLFEPSSYARDWVDTCLKEISISFLLRKPAIIETHRLNYIGSIVPENRERNLALLRELLNKILRKWPEVEFFNSEQLGDLIDLKNMPG